MTQITSHQLTTADQVTAVLGEAPGFVVDKVGGAIDESIRLFIARSPLIFIATHDGQGRADVSPKGDPPGFVEVIDETTLVIPERKGNNLADGLRNIIETGRIGLIFVIPGQRETVRVNGTATVHNDPALLDRLAVKGKPALLATVVTVEECFFHCGKSLIRSQVWQPETWQSARSSLMVDQIVATMGADADLAPAIVASVEQNYIDDLY